MSVEKRKMTFDKRKKYVNHLSVFKQRTKKDDNNELSERIIITARKTGELNLSSKGLSTGIYYFTNIFINLYIIE